jgi:hypothetical protein
VVLAIRDLMYRAWRFWMECLLIRIMLAMCILKEGKSFRFSYITLLSSLLAMLLVKDRLHPPLHRAKEKVSGLVPLIFFSWNEKVPIQR